MKGSLSNRFIHMASAIPARIAGTMLLFVTVVAMGKPAHFNFRSIDIPGATVSQAFGINPERDIVGRCVIDGVAHSYLLSNGRVNSVDIDPPYGIP